jgi:hypothetical protein
MISMLMTDADLCRRHALAGSADWQARLRLAHLDSEAYAWRAREYAANRAFRR